MPPSRRCPASTASRPNQAPPPNGIQNLYLAGDYTQTHWPATMESAARSGYLAADAILRQTENRPRPGFLVADLPSQWSACRLLGLGR